MPLDESTLNFKKRKVASELPIYYRNLHIRETPDQVIRMVQDRGINCKFYGYQFHKNKLIEGSLATVYTNERSRDILQQRTQNELDDFIATKLHVIRDNPYEIKDQKPGTKIVTEVDNDEVADKAFNLEKNKADGKIYGQL